MNGGLGDTPLGSVTRKTFKGVPGGAKVADPLGIFTATPKDNSAEMAARAEAERIAAIKAGIGSVNGIFDSPQRQAQYAQFLQDQRALYLDELNKKRGDAERNSRFALARGGQYGGRVAIDTAADLSDAYQRGVLNAERESQSATNKLKSGDEELRNSLITLVQSGLDATTATQRAQAGISNSLEGARANLKSGLMDDAFGALGSLWSNSQKRAEEQRARRQLGTQFGTASQWGYGGGNS